MVENKIYRFHYTGEWRFIHAKEDLLRLTILRVPYTLYSND
jgi:hypothetical protein